jgi:hypothetical protein
VSRQPSGVVVGEAAGQPAVSVRLVEQGLGLGLEQLDGVGARREPQRWLVQGDQIDQGGGELGGSPPC